MSNHSKLSELMLENAELRAECERLREQHDNGDFLRLQDNLEACRKQCERLKAELAQAKADNARLVAKCDELDEEYGREHTEHAAARLSLVSQQELNVRLENENATWKKHFPLHNASTRTDLDSQSKKD